MRASRDLWAFLHPELGGQLEASQLNEDRLAALLKLTEMAESSFQEIADFALEKAVQLTGSRVGYLAFTNEDESVLTMHAWSRSVYNDCDMSVKPRDFPVKDAGLWGEAIRQLAGPSSSTTMPPPTR